MSGISKAGQGVPSEVPPIRGDVKQEFVINVDLTKSAAAALDDSSIQVDGYLRQMTKRELGLRDTGHSVSTKSPDPDEAARTSKARGKLFIAAKANALALAGRAIPHAQKKRGG